MTDKPTIARPSAILLFAFFGIQGLWSSYQQFTHCDALGKYLQTFAVFGYGVVGLFIAIQVVRKKPVSRIYQIFWSIFIVVATSLAPSQWSDAPLYATASSFVGGVMLAAAGVWLIEKNSGRKVATGVEHANGTDEGDHV